MDKQLKPYKPKGLQKPQPKQEEGTIEKQAALYIYRPEVRIVCSECVFVKGDKCTLFGLEVAISRNTGTCGFYIHGHENPEQPWVSNVTKEEAGYMENKTGFQCKRCEEFLPGQQGCKKVDKNSVGDTPGIIAANACCNSWQIDDIRGKLSDDKLDNYLKTMTR